jgi:hypothetical protein
MSFLKEFSLVAVFLLGVASFVLLIHPNWRWTMAALGVQYLASAWLVSLYWPLGLAAVKLVVGLMAGAVLSTSQAGAQAGAEPFSGRLFRLIVSGLVLLVIWIFAPAAQAWLKVDFSVVLGGLILGGIGLLQTSMTNEPLRTVIGLLTFLAGFEILYAGIEYSVLVAGLLAVINLGLALAGAYLLAVAEPENSTEAG